MKILITGGAGFIGRHLLRQLPRDFQITIVDALDAQSHGERSDFAPALLRRARCIRADIRDTDSYAEAALQADVVVHLAAQTGTGQSMYEMSRYVQHNVDGTARLLDLLASRQTPPRRVVLASSRAIYGEGAYQTRDGRSPIYPGQRAFEDLQAGRWELYDANQNPLAPLPTHESHRAHPVSVYGWTKLWQEELLLSYAQNHDVDYAILRLQNVYGPGQELKNPYTGIVGIFTAALLGKGEVELFEDGLMTRDFVYVGDVARAFASAICESTAFRQRAVDGEYSGAAYSRSPGAVNIGSGEAITLRDFIGVLSCVCEREAHIRISGRFRSGDIRHAQADTRRAARVFAGWSPLSLERGLRRYVAWYRRQSAPDAQLVENSLREMAAKGLLHEERAAAPRVAA